MREERSPYTPPSSTLVGEQVAPPAIGLRRIVRVVCCYPAVCAFVIVSFAVRARLRLGYWPTNGFDPTTLGFDVHDFLAVLGILTAPLSLPVLLVALVFFVGSKARVPIHDIAFCGFGGVAWFVAARAFLWILD